MQRALLLAICLLVGCKEKANPVQVDPTPVPRLPKLSEPEFRTKSSLTVVEQGDVYLVSDGAARMKIMLPNKPTLAGDLVEQGGVEVFNAQAVMPGGDVDVQFGVLTVRDGDMPRAMVDMIANAPAQLATAAGGTLAKNEVGTLAGSTARVFELTTPDGRRLFGWYVLDVSSGRMYQINCVGTDTPKSRTACETVAKSLTLSPATPP